MCPFPGYAMASQSAETQRQAQQATKVEEAKKLLKAGSLEAESGGQGGLGDFEDERRNRCLLTLPTDLLNYSCLLLHSCCSSSRGKSRMQQPSRWPH